jgi:hypothetical protein
MTTVLGLFFKMCTVNILYGIKRSRKHSGRTIIAAKVSCVGLCSQIQYFSQYKTFFYGIAIVASSDLHTVLFWFV